MFKNIGKKIKALAKIICWLGIIFWLLVSLSLCGVYFLGADMSSLAVEMGGEQITAAPDYMILVAAAVTLIVGFLISWLGSFFMYGFGQLIDDTQRNREYNEKMLAILADTGNSSPRRRAEP